MADNRPTELMAEQRVTSELLKFQIKTSKPYFDENGTDLLLVEQVSRSSTAILRAQSKGRRYSKGKPSSVTIPIKYVSANFVLFLYVINENNEDALIVFFEDHLHEWRISNNNEYYLTLSEKSVAKLKGQLMSAKTADEIKRRLQTVEIKKYTTMLIDGIFLEKAIQVTSKTYHEIWPGRVLKKPLLTDIIHELLNNFNKYPRSVSAIQCQVFLSEHFQLEQWATMPPPFTDLQADNVRLTISKSGNIISFEMLEHLERVINNENILLVADDIVYESPLNKLSEDGTDVILIRLQTDLGGNLYTHHRWGDITRPIALAMGLEPHEI